MTKPWFAVEADVRSNDKLLSLPNDTARLGWFFMLGEAKLLRKGGTFSAGQWAEKMGRFARYLPTYIAAGLVHRAPIGCARPERCLRGRGPFGEGTLVVHDWPVHQREHAVRQDRYRNGASGSDTGSDGQSDGFGDALSDVSSDVQSDIHSRALSLSPVDINPKLRERTGREGVGERGDAHRLQALAEELTQQPYVMADVYGGYGLKAVAELLPHGFEAVERAWREVASRHPQKVTLRQLVFEAGDLLNPIAAPIRETPQQREERERKERAERINAEFAAKGAA